MSIVSAEGGAGGIAGAVSIAGGIVAIVAPFVGWLALAAGTVDFLGAPASRPAGTGDGLVYGVVASMALGGVALAALVIALLAGALARRAPGASVGRSRGNVGWVLAGVAVVTWALEWGLIVTGVVGFAASRH